jgi:hypothetical protein
MRRAMTHAGFAVNCSGECNKSFSTRPTSTLGPSSNSSCGRSRISYGGANTTCSVHSNRRTCLFHRCQLVGRVTRRLSVTVRRKSKRLRPSQGEVRKRQYSRRGRWVCGTNSNSLPNHRRSRQSSLEVHPGMFRLRRRHRASGSIGMRFFLLRLLRVVVMRRLRSSRYLCGLDECSAA